MKFSLLAIFLTFLVLMVVVVIVTTAFPSPREPREASADKQLAQDTLTPRRREPKRKGRLGQSSRQGKNYFGQRYSLGHGGVAFLMTGEVEVMRPSEGDLEPNFERDRCLGCCDVNATDNPELQGTERGDGNWIVAESNKNVTFITGANVPDLVGEEPFFIDDQCLDCCVIINVTPSPEPERGGGTPGLPTVNALLPSEAPKKKKCTLNQPTQQERRRNPSRFHLDYQPSGGISSQSSSEEIRTALLTHARDTAADGTGIQKLMKYTKKQPPQGRKRTHLHSSVSSSSEETFAAMRFSRKNKLSRRQ